MSELITLYGHRGGGDPYPDSSLESYTWGANWGADYLEPDLYITKDGVLVVSHDNISQGFANLTYAEAKALNPSLMTFGDVIELVKQFSTETGRDIGIIPELKDQSYAAAQALVQTLVAHDFTDPSRVVVQSFGAQPLQWLHDTLMPAAGVDFQLALLTSGISNVTGVAAYADIIAPSVGSFTAAQVQAAHAAGLKVVAWTLTGAEADIQKLVDLGVDGVFVDNMQMARTGEADIEGLKVIYGTPQWNVVTDTAGNDEIYAMQGDDIVRASGGNDIIYGDAGNDVLFGGEGDDLLVGGSGSDYLEGGAGHDILAGSTGNDVIVATGDEVRFRTGDGIDLVVADNASKITFTGIKSTDVTILQDGSYLIIRAGADALVLRDGVDAAHLPGTIVFADGVTWTGADLAAHATAGTDAAVEAALPGLEFILERAPALATASTVAVGTDVAADDGFGNGTLAAHIDGAEDGAVYRLTFSLSDLGSAEVKVLWNGEVLYQGAAEGAQHFVVTGGSGDGSNQLVFEGAANPAIFDATLSSVHLVKLADPGVPVPDNAAPVAAAESHDISQDLAFSGAIPATDADGDPLAYSLGEGPAHGTLKLDADGTYTYTPDAGFTGKDGFTYIVNDGHGGVAEAAIDLTVKPGVLVGANLIVNGSFEDVSLSTGSNGPSDWGYRNEGNPIVGWTEANGKRIEQHWDTTNGVSAKDGTFWVDMNGYQNNTDIAQTVARVETGATYLLSFSLADADATAGVTDSMKVLWGGQVIWSGVAPATGWETITVRVTGGFGNGSNKLEFVSTQSNATATTYGAALDNVSLVKLANVGDAVPDVAPNAQNGSSEGDQGTVIAGTLKGIDADNDALTFTLQDAAAHGTVKVNADGSFTYTPAAGFSGTDAFTFKVDDGHGGTDIATQTITVDPVAPAPVNLIVNGGFEDLTGADNGADWGYRNTSPAGVIPGWVNTSDTRAEVHRDTVGGIGPKEGSYWFDLEGAPNNATLVQTVAGIEKGATYQLKFSIADTDTAQTNDTVKVLWGGQVIYTGTPLAAWQEITIDVVGGAGDGSNKLTFQSITPSPNGAGVALDNVSMIKIDENPNLIVNGSFEDLTGANNGSATSSDWGFRNNSGVIPGWTQTNTAGGGRAEIHHDTQNGVSAADGNYWFDMDGNGNNANLVQTVAGVQAGKTYELQFSIADADGTNADDGIKVYWGGQLIYTGLPTNHWEQITIEVVGGAGDGSNKLVFVGNETNLSGTAAALDNVSLRLLNGNPNLIVNGSFEDLSQSSGYNGSGDWGYRNLNGSFAGWTDVNGNRIEQHWDTVNGITAKDGFMLVDLDGVGANTKMVQTVAGVVTGKTYDLSFSIADFDTTASNDGVRVSWGGQVVYEGLPPAGGWQTLTLHVVGGAGDGSNKLMFEGTGTGLNSYGTALDDVSLRASVETPIAGTAGDDVLAGTAGHDVFASSTGNDRLAGGADADTYLYRMGGGSDVIVEEKGAAGTDVLAFQDVNLADVTLYKHGTDVEIVLADGGKVTLAGQLDGTRVEMVTFADGSSLDAAGILAHLTDRAPVVTAAEPVTTQEDTPVSGQVIASDLDGDALTYAIKGNGAAHGTVSIDAHGAWTYTPAANVSGADSFTVTVSDGHVSVDTVVSLTINPVNDLPVTMADAATVGAHGTGTYDLVANDTDVEDGRPVLTGFTVTGVEGLDLSADAAASAFRIVDGKLAFAAGGLFPVDQGQHATVTLAYTATDHDGGQSTGQFVLTIEGDLHRISGTAGADTLFDTQAADHIVAGAGADVIYSYAGNDYIEAGEGNDTVYTSGGDKIVHGGAGDDVIYGGGGTSLLFGDAGNDRIYGSYGNETIDGGDGNDVLSGGGGNDVISGGAGDDDISGSYGNDVLSGGDGNDTITGGGGSDVITGGAGDDRLTGSYGDDVISGDDGNDVIVGGGGNDRLSGGAGDDRITGSYGNDVISGGDGNDVIIGGGGNDTISGGAGNDVITGDYGNDVISGDDGDDVIVGNGGNDILSGGAGNDIITGSYGNDVISGGDGNDTLIGGGGNDVIDGGAGDDVITGGYGNSKLIGGDGNDRITGGSGDEIISGGKGDDLLFGGAGSDTFVFAKGDGHDVVGDFQAQYGHDVVQLDHAAFADFAALLASGHVQDSAAGVVISYDDGSSLTIAGVTKSSLDSHDFIFS